MTPSPDKRAAVQRLARIALLACVALVLSYIETMIALPVAIPGVKLGLSNVAVLVCMMVLDWRAAGEVALFKVLAAGFLFGSPMMLAYSAGGTLLAFLGMCALVHIPSMDALPVSMVAAVLHNVGQIAVATFMLSSVAVVATLPVLAVAACVTGAVTGVIAQAVVPMARLQVKPSVEVDVESFCLKPGELVAIVGRNGSGKSTFVRSLAVQMGAGKAGLALQDPDSQITQQVVSDDVAFGLENACVDPAAMPPLVDEALERVGMLGQQHACVEELSGGQKQRVCIAGLLVLTPEVMILDEPTSMLDGPARATFMDEMQSLCEQGRSVVVVTQHTDEAFRANRIVVFDEGCIAEDATPEELLAKPERLSTHGLCLPAVARLSIELRARGVDVALTADEHELEEALCRLSA